MSGFSGEQGMAVTLLILLGLFLVSAGYGTASSECNEMSPIVIGTKEGGSCVTT